MSAPAPERLIDEATALRAVVEGAAAQTGEAFYKALVASLARALDTRGAWVTVYDPAKESLRALAFQFAGQWIFDFEYPISGTACETAIREKRMVHVPDRVIDLYAGGRKLGLAGVVSYLGAPILNEDKQVLGHVAVVDSRPMPKEKLLVSLFQLFADRASAEMRRLRLEAALRAREEKLTRLIDGAMDAIIEVDSSLSITTINTAAEALFHADSRRITGRSLDTLLGSAVVATVAELAQTLNDHPQKVRHAWIPGPFLVSPRGRDPFSAEATLSTYTARGEPYWTIILRSVDDRLRSEERIQALSAQTDYLKSAVDEARGFDEILGASPAIRAVMRSVSQVAPTDAAVLLLGETGTGKELFARAIHKRSPRRDSPLITVNCAAIPANLIESEFFGHERGAFTGATQRREGRFALADGGTIFLDEVGELPLELQGKLLRVLQEGEFEPVGGSRTRAVDVRVVAATNRDLEQAARDGAFRSDLYYRLNVFPIKLPPLRDRKDDVVLIANAFAKSLSQRMSCPYDPLSPAAAARLQAYAWPGNVRELRNVIERAIIKRDGGKISLEQALLETVSPRSLPHPSSEEPSAVKTVMNEKAIREIERANMIAALEQTDWRVGGENGAAHLIGISPSTFKSRMKVFDITRPLAAPAANLGS